jgi:hypothetical protein
LILQVNLTSISHFFKSILLDSVRKTIYELDDEIRGINVKDEDKARFAQTSLFRAQIKELIHQRQDLKEELQQTLKRLVLNRVPLPDIDGNELKCVILELLSYFLY